MKKRTNVGRALSVFLSFLMVLSVIAFPTLKAKAEEPKGTVDDFVERCYTVTLERPSDIDGFNYWKGKLLNGEAVGIEVAYGFLFSPEYTKKNKSNSAYVRDLYALFMGRDPDDSGYNDWMNRLDEGQSRLDVFAGFANSVEFYNLCCDYEITAGRYVTGYDRETINNVNLFVERLYKICLGRIGDRDGQKNWVEKLLRKEISGTECARSFIQSQEYVNKGLYDENYVENLYLAMMGRESDSEGYWNWIYCLQSGMTRDEVFAGFANSQEFANICAKYKIDKGSYTAKNIGTINPEPAEEYKFYRVNKTEYLNGDYILYGYDGDGNLINKKRYDKNGNYLGYDYRSETKNGEEFYGERNYYDDGSVYTFYQKTKYNSDKTQKTVYIYTDEWKTLDYYEVYEQEKYTYDGEDYSFDDYHPKKCTVYDAAGNKTQSVTYDYYSDNRPKKTVQRNASGKLTWVAEYEYYERKGNYDTQCMKKRTETYYDYLGVEYRKEINDINENGDVTKWTLYMDKKLNNINVFEYDSKGRNTTLREINSDGIETYRTDYKYDVYGNQIRTTSYRNGTLDCYIESVYSGNNELLRTCSYDKYNNLIWRVDVEYDEKGHQTKFTSSDSYGLRVETNEYDSNLNYVITKTTKTLNGTVIYSEKNYYEEYN